MTDATRKICLLMVCMLALQARAADEKKSDFTTTVVRAAIGVLPKELQSKIAPSTNQIISSAHPKAVASKTEDKAEELYYYVSEKKGKSVEAFTEEFRQARKLLAEKAEISSLAPTFGRLAFVVISLSQPYHSDEAAYKSSQHTEFEKELNANASAFRVTAEGNQTISDPSEFASTIAKKASEYLKKLSAADGASITEISSSVFNLAVNSLASTWWTLLTQEQVTTKNGYVGNKRSLKFHLPTCKMLPAERNRVYFETREQAIKEGYVPCKICKP